MQISSKGPSPPSPKELPPTSRHCGTTADMTAGHGRRKGHTFREPDLEEIAMDLLFGNIIIFPEERIS